MCVKLTPITLWKICEISIWDLFRKNCSKHSNLEMENFSIVC
jgi:hypothetical protein